MDLGSSDGLAILPHLANSLGRKPQATSFKQQASSNKLQAPSAPKGRDILSQ